MTNQIVKTSIALDENLLEKLRLRAKTEQRSVSFVIRAILEKELAPNPQTPSTPIAAPSRNIFG